MPLVLLLTSLFVAGKSRLTRILSGHGITLWVISLARMGSFISVPIVGVIKGLLGFTNIYDTIMSLLSCLCETTTMILSCFIYRRLRFVRGLKPLTRHLSLASGIVQQHEAAQAAEEWEFELDELRPHSPVLHV